MKHLKSYENIIKDEPQIGDYVIINANSFDGKFKDFLDAEIGKITDIVNNNGGHPYVVKFKRKFSNFNNTIAFKKTDFLSWNKNLKYIKKDRELKRITNKYNI